MAAKAKKSQTTAKKSKSANAKQTSKKNTVAKKPAKASLVRRETLDVRVKSPVSADVILWSTLAVSLLLFISELGFGGIVGNNIGRFFFGLFGILSYIFPFVLLVSTFFLVSNRKNEIARAKVISAVCLFFFASCGVELMLRGENVVSPAMAYLYGFETKTGGGFFGGLLAFLFVKGFGLVGAYVLDVIAIIITLVLITEKSAFRFLSNKSQHQRIKRQMQKKERIAKRNKNFGNGVTTATLISDTARAGSDNMNEVSLTGLGKKVDVDQINRISLRANEASEHKIPMKEANQEPSAVAEAPIAEEKPKQKVNIHIANAPETAAEKPAVIKEDAPIEKPETAAEEKLNPSRPRSTKETREQTEKDAQAVSNEIEKEEQKPKKDYVFPSVELLNLPKGGGASNTAEALEETAKKLEQTLENFGVNVTVTDVSCGPAVTRYELQPEMGVKVSRITNLADDIKLNLAAADIRIEAPIPGKSAVGIEVPNKETVMVSFRELMESKEFATSKSKIAFAAGRDIGGNVIISDIAKMPHLLIAGSTGSGKSVCINTIIMSILYKAKPEEVKLIMVDPKVVELSVYNGIPHLLIPVVTDPKKAAGALHWAVQEMTDRYQKFADAGVRDMAGYNEKIKNGQMTLSNGDKIATKKMPQIVVIVDELADLMMVSSKEVEEAICRLAQLARAAGIHLIIATQRPSVNVITGLIKANMPSRIAFAVTSGVDSRTILDMNGAEKLLGKGDMLYYPQGFTKPLRVQGSFVSDEEVSRVVSFVKDQFDGEAQVDESIQSQIEMAASASGGAMTPGADGGDERDGFFADAGRLIIEKEKGSIGMLQRNFKIGFNRAARIMDQLEDAGVVGPEEGTKPRRVLVSIDEFEQMVS